MKTKLLLGLFIVFATLSCIDPIRLQTEETAGMLVVDGFITDESGPVTVNLSRSITFDNSRPLRVFALPETGAQVSISDGTVAVPLSEATPGVYSTLNITGQVGKSYSVSITTKDGKTYHSTVQRMLPVAEVDGIIPEFTVYGRFFINSNNLPRTEKALGFNIYVSATDPKGLGNSYRWEVSGIYEFFAVTENPAGYICWATIPRMESTLQLSTDALVDGKKFTQLLCVVPYERPTRFMVKLKQSSLTEEAFAYWKNSQGQQTSTGSLFDPPATTVTGNIVDEDGSPTLGHFTVSSVVRKNFLFDRQAASGFVTPHPNIVPRAGDCRTHVPGATNVRPEGF